MTSVRVGANTLAEQVRRRNPVYDNTHPWIAPPAVIPSSAYNPTLDIELAAGKRGTRNTIEDLLTKGTRGEQGFALDQAEVKRQEGEQGQEHQRVLAALAQNYERLGGRQTEQANAAGVSRGGALLQAAMKRKANEGKAAEPINLNYQHQQEGDQRSLARLALSRQQEGEDIGTGVSRAEREQTQFGIDTNTVKAREATNNGYLDSGGVVARTSTQPGAGFVRVGGAPRVNPYANWGRR